MSDAGTPPPADVKPKADGKSSRACPSSPFLASPAFVHSRSSRVLIPDNTLNIKIVSTDGNEVFFKIKKTTKLNKLKVSRAALHLCSTRRCLVVVR
jgi:small ubiquitin-related modifier